jgi:uncharacterized protein (TIGR02145 family)
MFWYILNLNNEEKAWESACVNKDYAGYINEYPDGKYEQVARIRMEELRKKREKLRKKIAKSKWEICKSWNDFERYKEYRETYPDGIYANDKIYKDIDLWEESVKVNTLTSYMNYLRNYPEGLKASEAMDSIAVLSGKNNNPDITATNDLLKSNQSKLPGKYDFASWRILQVSDLENIGKWELKVMRNEIFARHGYVFKTEALKIYFNEQKWYRNMEKRTPDDDCKDYLTEIEKLNIKLIQSYEKKKETKKNKIKKDFFADSRDGQTYKWVKIGEQLWMAENLNYKTNNSWCYDNNPANCDVYGRLYNWSAALTACPDGWHLPSDDEWKTLEMHLGMSQSVADDDGWRGTDEGGKLKETGTTHWDSPNTGASNISGFTAIPGGNRRSNGTYYNFGLRLDLWSSTSYPSYQHAWDRYIGYETSQIYRGHNDKSYGRSVRCVKD